MEGELQPELRPPRSAEVRHSQHTNYATDGRYDVVDKVVQKTFGGYPRFL